MKQSKMLIPTLREMPSDAQVISHAFDVACRLCSPSLSWCLFLSAISKSSD